MGYTAILENSIMQKGKPATAGSKMLEGFISPISATVAERLETASVDIIGRSDMDEFGLNGLFGGGMAIKLSQAKSGLENNPAASDVVCAIDCVASSKVDFALCNDYTGAVSQAVGEFNLCYIHPTYGTVSRYGLIPAVTSIDQIGVICKNPDVGFDILRIISGYDSKDGVMKDGQGQIKHRNRPHVPVSIAEYDSKYSGICKQVMQILCCAELSNNISRYDGIKYGYRSKEYNGLRELYSKSRTEAFGEDVKLAAVLGAMVLSQENYERYYDKAMRLRRMIKDSLDFADYDVIVTKCHMLSRLCGLPSLSTPEHVYIADTGREDVLESVLLDNKFEKITDMGDIGTDENATEGGGL